VKLLLDVTVPGLPIPKARARVVRDEATEKVRSFTPKKSKDWENRITGYLLAAGAPKMLPVDMPVLLELEVGRRASSSGVPGWDVDRPDIDNIMKSVMDALAPSSKNKGAWVRVLQDDAQICATLAYKRTLSKDETPFVRFRLFQLLTPPLDRGSLTLFGLGGGLHDLGDSRGRGQASS
jgi:Holliday junction resolvase RusA-like endonuclease